jgi:hypothetical protein
MMHFRVLFSKIEQLVNNKDRKLGTLYTGLHKFPETIESGNCNKLCLNFNKIAFIETIENAVLPIVSIIRIVN